MDHFDDPESAIAEMARVTKRDGRVVLAIANFDSLACRMSRAIDRIREALCICRAIFGKISLISTPLALVLMGLKNPAVGRPGFGSQVSMWLIPPPFQKRMTCWAVPAFGVAARISRTGIPRKVASDAIPLLCSMRRRVMW